jgi:hypothetical protein
MGDKLNLEPRDFGRNWLAGGFAMLNLASPVIPSPVPASAALLDPRRQQGEGTAPLAPWGFQDAALAHPLQLQAAGIAGIGHRPGCGLAR